MSWQIFKNNLVSFSKNVNAINSIDVVAKKWADEYDACIKRGGVKYLNQIPLTNSPNKESMQNLFALAFKTGLSSTVPYSLVTEMGRGVLAYWGGASLQAIIPGIPAAGTSVNLASNTNYISSVGVWNPVPPTPPTKEVGILIDSFILAAQLHLSTLQGVIITTSLSISVPPLPMPGLIFWTGYSIDPADKTTISSALQKIENIDPSFTNEEIEDLKTEVESRKPSQKSGVDALLEQEDATLDAYYQAIEVELKSGRKLSVEVNLTNEEIKDVESQIPQDTKCPAGVSIVRAARKDVGLLETGAYSRINGKSLYPAGTNMGGLRNASQNPFKELPTQIDKNGKYVYTPGRIDEMIDFVLGAGVNKKQWEKNSYGIEWCGCAVATWWASANQPYPKGAGWVGSWKSWGIERGLWISAGQRPPFNKSVPKPKLGAAVIYGGGSNLYHIGIVSGIIEKPNGTWTITTIEGNTGGPLGLKGRGICCNEKSPTSLIDGFTNPPACK